MIKKNNPTTNHSICMAIAQILFICALFSNSKIPASANNYSTNKRTALTANLDSHQDPIRAWFNNYDQIRRQSQLSPAERQRADQIMGRGLSIFMPGSDKALAQNLLTDLVKRYELASQQMANLQVIQATEQLHRAYYQYFIDAKNLFSDYLKLQDDLLATDSNTGQPVASGLVERKENLAILDQNNKMLDERLRQQFNIPAYQYQPATQPHPLNTQQSSDYPSPYQNPPYSHY